MTCETKPHFHCEKEHNHFKSKIGQILWGESDVMFDALNLASKLKSATVQTIHKGSRIVCQLKSVVLKR